MTASMYTYIRFKPWENEDVLFAGELLVNDVHVEVFCALHHPHCAEMELGSIVESNARLDNQQDGSHFHEYLL